MKPTLAAVVLGLAVLAGHVATSGASLPGVDPPLSASPGLIVHEWGTFTSFSGLEGAPVNFQPDNSSLPGFVYHHGGDPGSKSRLMIARGTISMETPVLYFYTDRQMQASVRVGLPKGWITEWYPHATRPPDDRIIATGRDLESDPGESIQWEVKLLPGESLHPESGKEANSGLPVGHWAIEFANGVTEACEIRGNGSVSVVEPQRSSTGAADVKDGAVVISFADDRVERWKPKGDRFTVEHWGTSKRFPAGMPVLGMARRNPYFHARETDSVPLETTFTGANGRITQREKFLFYRGVGIFPPPITVQAEGGGKVRIRNASGGRATGLVLVVVRSGRVGFLAVGDLEARGEIVASLPPEASTLSMDVGGAVEKALVAAGLYEREAKAMVKTWDQPWFHEEGNRLLYLVPQARTDELLPLTVGPRPTETVRVMVGRHDFLTPEQETAVDLQLERLRLGQTNEATADAEIAILGRFAKQARQMAQERLAKAGR